MKNFSFVLYAIIIFFGLLEGTNAKFINLKNWDIHRDVKYIFICSDFSSVNSNRLKRFFKNIFPDKNPIIIDGYRRIQDTDTTKLVLFAARKEPSKLTLDCLNNFSALPEDKKKEAFEKKRQLGKAPLWENEVKMAKYYDAIKTVITISTVKNWSFLYIFSVIKEYSIPEEFFTAAFGLPTNFCRNNPDCK